MLMIVDVFNVYFKEVVRCVSSQPFSPSNFKDHLSVRRDPLELRDWFIWLMCQGEFGTFVSSPPKKAGWGPFSFGYIYSTL